MHEKIATPRLMYKRSIFLAAVCTVLVATPYISALTHIFDYHDSFFFYAYENHLRCGDHPQFNFFFLVGRPLYAYLNCYLGALVTRLQDAAIIRAIGVAVLIISAIWIAGVFAKIGMPAMLAAVAACALIWLPGFQFFVGVTQATPIVFSLPLVVASFVELDAGCAALDRRAIGFASLHLMLSTLFLLVAAQIFQQMTSLIFCFVFAAIWHLGSEFRKSARVLIAGSIVVFGIQGLLYLVTYHTITAPIYTLLANQTLAEASTVDSTRDIALSTDIGAKLHLLYELTPGSFALWLAGPPAALYGTVIALSLAAVLASVALDVRIGRNRPIFARWVFPLEKLVWLGGLILLVNAPNLVAKTNSLFLRHMIPYQWLIILLLLSTGWRLAGAFGGVAVHRLAVAALTCFAAIGVGTASWNLYRNLVLPNAGEFSFIQGALGGYEPTEAAPACVFQPGVSNVGALAHPETQIDEFGKLTTMFPQDVPWIISAAVASYTGELNGNARVLDPAESPTKFHCGAVIDMRRYASRLTQLRAAAALFGEQKELFGNDVKGPVRSRHRSFEVTGGDTGTGLHSAFDGSVKPDSFWEAAISSPVTLDVSYSSPTLIDHYGFESGETGERMPKSWSLLASNDGKTWVKLDTRSLQDPWSPNQRRLFQFDNHVSFLKFRFIFVEAFDPQVMRIYEILL